MIRVRSLAVAAVVLFGAAVAAQQKPNFSGTWIVVTPAEAAGQEETFKQDATTLVRGHASERDGHSFTYKLDGSESRNVLSPHAGEEVVSVATASWKGDALVIDETTTYPNGRKHQTRRTLSLDANGMLRLEMSRTIDGKEQPPITVTYRKKA